MINIPWIMTSLTAPSKGIVPERKVHNTCFCQTQIALYIKKYWEYKNKGWIIEKPYKVATRNAKENLNFSKFVTFLGHFLKKQCFWKMGVAGIKRLPRPSKIGSFSWKLNGEALLKVSSKNVDRFQKYKALKWKITF